MRFYVDGDTRYTVGQGCGPTAKREKNHVALLRRIIVRNASYFNLTEFERALYLPRK